MADEKKEEKKEEVKAQVPEHPKAKKRAEFLKRLRDAGKS
jgi:hypothetical protein